MKPITHCAITRWPSLQPEIGEPLASQDNLPWAVKSEALHDEPRMMWRNADIRKKNFQLQEQEIIRLLTGDYSLDIVLTIKYSPLILLFT